VQPRSGGLIERNEIATHKKAGICVANEAAPTVRGNRVHGSPVGIIVSQKAQGIYTDNDVRGNARLGIHVEPSATPVSCEGNVSDLAPLNAPQAGGTPGRDRGRDGRRR
jgi:nitrous oxidase accessory protein NosD